MIGPWCFLDRFGPLRFLDQKPMDVAPHPHIGLQTLTWLFSGEVLHNDSLGNECMIRPGQISLMTAGKGIAHTEETPSENSGLLDGVQFWIALPALHRETAPSYLCTSNLQQVEVSGATASAFVPSTGIYSPTIGAEYRVHPGSSADLPMDRTHEHGLVLIEGDCQVEGETLAQNTLYYLAPGPDGVSVSSRQGARLLILGGLPFPEKILMWWNFVARDEAEILAAREAWERQERFGSVPAYRGARLAAPPLSSKLLPNKL